MKKIKLGVKIKDTVTGFIGITVVRCEYLNGCVRYGVQGPMKDGESKIPEAEYIDIQQMEVIKEEKEVKVKKDSTGGDRPNPKDRITP